MIYYISNADIPGKQAHTIQQMKMCQAFRRNGREVCFLHPSYGKLRKNVSWESISEYYGLEAKFNVRTIPSLQSKFQSVPKLQGLSMAATMTSWLTSQTLLGTITSADILYGRNYYGMVFFNKIRQVLPKSRQPTIVFEIHTPISTYLKQQFFESVDWIVSITNKLKKYLVDKYRIDPDKVIVAPDGVDLEPYKGLSKEIARERLGFRQNEPIVMYTGHLYRGKGVETLIKAARGLDAAVYIVGGYNEDIQRVKAEVDVPNNVVFTGFMDPAKIPVYQVAADVLVAPYTSESRPWISPLKLFEYMAAGRPIVASDREVLEEVLEDGVNALIFERGNADSLEQQIERLLRSKSICNNLSKTVSKDVEKYRWENRASRILSLLLNPSRYSSSL